MRRINIEHPLTQKKQWGEYIERLNEDSFCLEKLKITLDKLPGLWYIDHRPGNYNYEEDKL